MNFWSAKLARRNSNVESGQHSPHLTEIKKRHGSNRRIKIRRMDNNANNSDNTVTPVPINVTDEWDEEDVEEEITTIVTTTTTTKTIRRRSTSNSPMIGDIEMDEDSVSLNHMNKGLLPASFPSSRSPLPSTRLSLSSSRLQSNNNSNSSYCWMIGDVC